MALGPGKYDDLATDARKRAKAAAVILVVFDGADGSGFSCQAPAYVVANLPAVLRKLADSIEGDMI